MASKKKTAKVKSTLRPILDHILFKFEDELVTYQGIQQFKETRASGIYIHTSFDHNAKQPRWINVVAVGPDVSEEVQPGMRVLVEPLKWTPGVKYHEEEFWMTKEENILAVDDEV